MPRCYMVKKQSNKSYQTRDCWDASGSATVTTSSTATTASLHHESTGAPESPTEGCVAPPYYTPLTNRSTIGYSQEEFIPNGTVLENTITATASPTSKSPTPQSQPQPPTSITTPSSPNCSITSIVPEPPNPFKARSAEETEAAHDLLSLSQSLPPLPAPGVVTIHHSVPIEERPPSPATPCYYRPLSPELVPSYHVHQHHRPTSPIIPIATAIPCYPHPIVYVVQVPAAPTPPTSECSSDAENLQLACGPDRTTKFRTISGHPTGDILILPLSPDSDSRFQDTTPSTTHTICEANTIGGILHQTSNVPVIVSASTTSAAAVVSAKQETNVVIASSHLNIPDRRKRKNKKTNKSNNNKQHQQQQQNSAISSSPINNTNSNHVNNVSDNDVIDFAATETAADATAVTTAEAKTSRTKFYKVVVDDDDPDELPADPEPDPETDDAINSTSSKTSIVNRYSCGECGRQYATSSNLSRHKQTHRSLDSQSAKKCMTCGKAYVSMPALAMHLLTHKLAHGCGICGKQFSRPWLLQGHLRSHTGEKPYGCAHCGKAFADRSNLRAHMQTHSGDKNFSCDLCHKTFALKSYLNKHQETACLGFEDRSKKVCGVVEESVRSTEMANAETQTIEID